MSGNDAFDEDEVLVVADLVNELHYSDRYIRDLLNNSRIKGTKLNERGQWRILRSDLNRFKKEIGLSGKAGFEQTTKSEAKDSQTVLDTEQSNLARQHDVTIFKKSDAILSEQDIEIVLGIELEAAKFIGHSEQSDLVAFYGFFSFGEETNKYINLTLRSLSESVCQKLVQLQPLIHHLFIEGSIYDGDGKKIHGRVLSELIPPEDIRQLMQLSASCRAAYRSYRAAVRETLFL